ncbi:MAG: hypothetical protein AB1521_16805 [Bacteroidota bacterium]
MINEEKKHRLTKYWQIILFIAITLFNIGYTVARMETFATKEEVAVKISEETQKLKQDTQKEYVKIDQIPGLTESLISINGKLDDLKNRFEKLEDKIIYSNK